MKSPAHILVVDDSRTQAELLRHLLESDGYSSAVVYSGTAALEEAKRTRPDLIISDIVMPGMDGYEMCSALKGDPALADIPVILLTQLADSEDIIRGLNAHADYYLTKPFDHDYLRSRVRTLLNEPTSGTDGDTVITVAGHKHTVSSTPRQMLSLLISTYESAIQQNRKLGEAQVEMRSLYEKLAQDRNLLRTLVDTLPESIFIKDAEGHYILDNLTHMHLLGAKSPEDVTGKTVFDFFPKDIAEAYKLDDERVLQSGEPQINREEESSAPDGSPRWLSTTKMPFRDAAGNCVGLVCASRDITERKIRQEQLATYAEELRQKNSQMEEELNMARELQQAFLPPQVFHFPRSSDPAAARLQLCHHFLPAAIIGGDFFDMIPLSDTEAAVFVGDVMGHGVRPALVTAMVRGLTQQLRHTAGDPGRFLTELNHGLVGILRQAQMPIFATGFFLVLDTAAGQLSYANAGHPAPVHLHADGTVERLRASPGAKKGMALGVFHEALYSTSRCTFQPGDRIVLFTDGLFEVEGSDGSYYDEKHLAEALGKRDGSPLPDTFSRLLDEIRHFSATQHFEDDLCLVGIDVLGIGPANSIQG